MHVELDQVEAHDVDLNRSDLSSVEANRRKLLPPWYPYLLHVKRIMEVLHLARPCCLSREEEH